jgi:chromosome segregation ATPase
VGGVWEVMEYDFRLTLPFILTVVTIVYTWWRTRDRNVDDKFKAVGERFNQGSERMDRHETRLASIEQTLRGLPAKQDMHELQISITELKGELKTMAAVIDGRNRLMERLENIVERHEDHLLDGSKK